MSPLVPDSNYHLFALGLGYSQPSWAVNIAYQFICRETRRIGDNIYRSQVDGTWNNNFNELMLTLTLKL